MQPTYDLLRERARKIVSEFSPPDFYNAHPRAHHLSKSVFNDDPTVNKLRHYLEPRLEDDFGHGLRHAIKVAVDAGSLLAIEGIRHNYSESAISTRICLVQCAGLLHDIKRKKKNHSSRGALKARQILERFTFPQSEIRDICLAIMNHEAFQPVEPLDTVEGQLVSDCLYDADKFRWGPDNFTETVWLMVAARKIPLKILIDHFLPSLRGIEKISKTFRTPTGREYGPDFISRGLKIGEMLHAELVKRFARS